MIKKKNNLGSLSFYVETVVDESSSLNWLSLNDLSDSEKVKKILIMSSMSPVGGTSSSNLKAAKNQTT